MSNVTKLMAAGWEPSNKDNDEPGTFEAKPDTQEWPELQEKLEYAENNAPRSLQREIGPSEMGSTCVHCLAARLAGWQKQPQKSAPLQPWIGTAAHAANQKLFGHVKNMEAEYPVNVCRLFVRDDIMRVHGHIDLWDIETATTVDWKFVGQWTWDRARRGITSQEYRIQASLYGIGLDNEGHTPKRSVLVFFNRASGRTFKDGVTTLGWDWEPQSGMWAINRCQQILNDLTRLKDEGGRKLMDDWISELPRAEFCFNCSQYPDYVYKFAMPQKPKLPKWAWQEIKTIPATYKENK